MAQNIYDNPEFHAGYSTLGRQVHGLDGAAEWPEMRALLPEVSGARVLDLGCGFGWFARWAAERGAHSVLGVDVSSKMLERAQEDTEAASVRYQQLDLDEFVPASSSFDVAFSSLAFHYVRDLDRLLSATAGSLAAGGALVFSVEHPIYSAPSTQAFETSQAGDRVWPLDNYLAEGERVTSWFVDGVVKRHRTVATYVNAVINAGFVLDRMVEFGASTEQAQAHPERADDVHRPWFLLLKATRSGAAR